MDQLVVVDYQEGAGGEFLASFISAHFGHTLSTDLQRFPIFLQKWLNSQSRIKKDWDKKFDNYFNEFLDLCRQDNISKIAVSYHLYQWPHHIDTICKNVKNVRFVKINCLAHTQIVEADFRRKVWDKKLTIDDFKEIKFLLSEQNTEYVKQCLQKLREQTLTVADLYQSKNYTFVHKALPSKDIEIFYDDFFVNFSRTPSAYKKLCADLNLTYDNVLLDRLIERNKKNYKDALTYMKVNS